MKIKTFSLFIAFFPIFSFSLNINTINNELEKAQSKASSYLSPQIKKKTLTLRQESALLENSPEWKSINNLLKALKSTPEYKSFFALQTTHTLLCTLEGYAYLQPHPELLEAISNLLKPSSKLDNTVKSFLQKERAWLMDNADDVILLQKKQNSINALKDAVLKEQQQSLHLLLSTKAYKALQQGHQGYLKEKRVKKITSLIDKITTLEYEKTTLITSSLPCQQLHRQKQLLEASSLIPSFSPSESLYPSLEHVSTERLRLFIAPLNILIL
ncbi:MAG: putative O-linked N-acetylglucosamine transferase (SPINDLY family) [Alteromonas naphthalenivorans]|jgi:predicted O-linked N-acetylglucosamine transferase (SPINDLY family)